MNAMFETLDDLQLMFPEVMHVDLGDCVLYTSEDVKEGEKVLGTINSDGTKRLFRMVEVYYQKRDEVHVRSKYASSQSQRAEARDEAARYDEQARAIRGLALVSTHTEIGHWEECIAVRKDWKVVAHEHRQSPNIKIIGMPIPGGDDDD